MDLESWGRWLVCRVLSYGPLPSHIAFIMDGNRRFAVKNHIDKKEGHSLGFSRLQKVLEWCLDLGVRTMTIYAFSIENFKRPAEEVDALMQLARVKFQEILQEGQLVQRHGVSVRLMGNISLLPLDIQQILAKSVYESRNNTRAVLNVCFAYTSREEIQHAVASLADGVADGLLQPSDITEDVFEACLYGADPPDLLVRTSGEHRLSDFLTWQSSVSCISFLDVLWPEFSLWDLAKTLLHYQQNHAALVQSREALAKAKVGEDVKGRTQAEIAVRRARVAQFVAALQAKEAEQIRQLALSYPGSAPATT